MSFKKQPGTVLLRQPDATGNMVTRGNLELKTGTLRDDSGKVLEQFIPMGGDVDELALSDYAARCNYSDVARQVGHPVTMRDSDGDSSVIKMDLGQADVHTDAALPNYAAGYRLADGVADIASPVIVVPKASNKYNTWDAANAFRRVLPNGGVGGGGVNEVNPTLSSASYQTVEYALGAFVPQNVQANADAPLQPYQAAVKRVVNALKLEREIRVATLMQTSGTWDSSVVKTVAAGAKWNGGATSDPIKDIFTIMEASAMPVTKIIMSEVAAHAFMLNPTVQAKIYAKSGVAPLPGLGELSSTLKLPPMVEAKMKYYLSGTTLSYVWGNHVTLIHEPPSNPPTDQEEVASNYTFRWNGGDAPDGAITAGWMVRTFFDPKRGSRGGTMCVIVHNDIETQTSKLAGGLIINAVQ